MRRETLIFRRSHLHIIIRNSLWFSPNNQNFWHHYRRHHLKRRRGGIPISFVTWRISKSDDDDDGKNISSLLWGGGTRARTSCVLPMCLTANFTNDEQLLWLPSMSSICPANILSPPHCLNEVYPLFCRTLYDVRFCGRLPIIDNRARKHKRVNSSFKRLCVCFFSMTFLYDIVIQKDDSELFDNHSPRGRVMPRQYSMNLSLPTTLHNSRLQSARRLYEKRASTQDQFDPKQERNFTRRMR